MTNCKISKISYYLPERVMSNQDFAGIFPEWNAEQIEQKVGIVQRHIAAEGETAADMAVKAAEKVFESYDRGKVDFVLFCTQSPDYKLPASSCTIQDLLKLRTDVGALDFNQGCSGYVYGLSMAKGLIASGAARSVLLLTGETYSKYIRDDDKVNRTIFGDAATATIVETSDSEQIGEFVFGTDGAGADKLIVKEGGARAPFTSAESPDAWIYMDGPQIFNFTIKTVPPLFNAVLDKNNETLESLDHVVFHQANAYMLNFLRRSIGIPEDKFFMDMRNTGNTVSNSIPIALAESLKKGLYANGAKIALIAFGVGLSWSGTIIEINEEII